SCLPCSSRWPALCWPARSAAGGSPGCGPPTRCPGSPDPGPALPRTGEKPVYQLTSVAKLYHKGRRTVPAVQDLTLTICDGQWLAIQGRTGHGKSTLLNLLGGLDRPTEGTIELDGTSLGALPETRLTRLRAEKIGFIFQTFNLIPTLSAAENVEAALIPLGVSGADRAARVAAALDSVGLADRAAHLPTELSGGQQQRVAIARALVQDPQA